MWSGGNGLWEEFRLTVSEQTLSRHVRAISYRKPVPRPRHRAQDPQAIDETEKVSPPLWQKLSRELREGNEEKFGFRMRLGSVRKTRSRTVGSCPERALGPLPEIKVPDRSTSSEQSARSSARRRRWSGHGATPMQ
ncbi:winged helix-turn-helix domain-containing protein [Rhizobium skierniewicense]|uniref:winged helix-turn-helix domain-containing protein n=1 Tax=Rhizobium skierniewicense TaxID=984260 RepID=UPI00160A37D9